MGTFYLRSLSWDWVSLVKLSRNFTILRQVALASVCRAPYLHFKDVNAVQSCFDVASYFIGLAHQTEATISNLKLQKLVYYSQAWHLAIHGTPLFEEDFQAWVHGPVVPDLYQKYQAFGWQPIQEDASSDLSEDVLSFLNEVAEEYFTCDAYELEQMTHVEAPWNQARGDLPPDAPSNAVIKKEWMKEYYGARGEENTENQAEAISGYYLLV
jgi:uncharacterized phage-associated protein